MVVTIGILLIIVGAAIIGYWIIFALKGHLPQGLRTVESGGYISFHILAEITTAIICIIGGIWLVLTLQSGNLVAIFGSGMLLYTSINGLAWKEVKNKPMMFLLFLPPAIVAILSAVFLILF